VDDRATSGWTKDPDGEGYFYYRDQDGFVEILVRKVVYDHDTERDILVVALGSEEWSPDHFSGEWLPVPSPEEASRLRADLERVGALERVARAATMSSKKNTPAWDVEADKLFGSWNGELLSAYSDEARKCCEQLARALAAAYERGREESEVTRERAAALRALKTLEEAASRFEPFEPEPPSFSPSPPDSELRLRDALEDARSVLRGYSGPSGEEGSCP